MNVANPSSATLEEQVSHSNLLKPAYQNRASRVLLPPWTSYSLPVVPNQYLDYMPPVIGDANTASLTFDFSLLLLFDTLVVDRETINRISADRKNHIFSVLHETFHILASEGRLEYVNCAEAAKRAESDIKSCTASSIIACKNWLKPIDTAIEQWLQRGAEMGNVFGTKFGPEDKFPHGPKFVLFENGKRLTERAMAKLRAKLKQCDQDPSLDPDGDIKRMVIAYLSYINTNLVLSDYFGCPIYDWPNFDDFYRTKFRDVGVQEPLELRQRGLVKKVFQLLIPDCRPANPKDFLRMLNDKHLNSFRHKLSEWTTLEKLERIPVDIQSEMAASIKAFNNASRLPHKKFVLWGINAAKFLGAVPSFHKPMLVLEAGLELHKKALVQHMLKPHQWYFFTQTLLGK